MNSRLSPVWHVFVVLVALVLQASSAEAQSAETLRLGVVVGRSGPFEAGYGKPFLDSVRLAVDEANKADALPRVEISVFDDRSTADGSREAAARVGEGPELAVVGPELSVLALPAGPVFEQSGIAAIA
jgi:ABC-type branched-subunit amino acid transport system substrate-binding protein